MGEMGEWPTLSSALAQLEYGCAGRRRMRIARQFTAG